MTEKWTEGLEPDDFTGDLNAIAHECGVETALMLAEKFPSMSLYIPKLETVFVAKKEAYVIEHFTGANHAELAREIGCSKRWVYDIIARDRETLKQVDLFETSTNK